MERDRIRSIVVLGAAVALLALVDVSYPARFFGVESEASLAHLHTGLLLAIAIVFRERRWLLAGIVGNLLVWEWKALGETPTLATALAGVAVMAISYVLLRIAARLIRWPAAEKEHSDDGFKVGDIARATLVGSVLLPLAIGLSWLPLASLFLGAAPLAPSTLSGVAQTVLAKCFGTLILTLPLVVLATETGPATRDGRMPSIPWLPLLVAAAVPMLLVDWLGASPARDGALVLFLDYRLIVAGLLLLAVVALPTQVSMPLLVAVQAVFAVGLAIEAGHGRDLADVLGLLRAAFELVVLQLLMLATFHYHRERSRNLRAMGVANEALSQRNHELQRFVMVASHDLQEPLRKIMTFGNRIVVDGADNLSARQRDDLERIDRSATRMRALIEGLLDYSRVSTSTAPREAVDLATVAADVLEDLAPAIEASGARIDCAPLPTISANPMQMHQVLQNLIGNALRYRAVDRPPQIRVDATLSTDSNGARWCRLRVVDNGIGFAPEHAERIFGLFQRLHDRSSHEGTGLDLAIVRRIAEQHQGTASAIGRPGEGAEFRVDLRVG